MPLLILGMVQALRGSGRAAVVWLGMLRYLVYAYAFYVVGAEFNDVFLVHVGIVVGAATAPGPLLRRLDASLHGFHTVFVVDLCLLVPSLVLGGLLLWRRVPMGCALGAAVGVFGAVYQLNLMSAGVFQATADVPDTTRVSVQGVSLTLLSPDQPPRC